MQNITIKKLGFIKLLVLLLSARQCSVNHSSVDAFTFTPRGSRTPARTFILSAFVKDEVSSSSSVCASTSASSTKAADTFEKQTKVGTTSSKSSTCDGVSSASSTNTQTTTHEPPRKNQQRQKRRRELASKDKIFSTIESLIKARNFVKRTTETEQKKGSETYTTQGRETKSMGILGEVVKTTTIDGQKDEVDTFKIPQIPKPGTILLPQKAPLSKTSDISKPNLKDHISITVARPEVNDAEIANLRLSVFNEYSIENNRKEWIGMSCDVINQRRNKGATCICASVNYIDDKNGNENENLNTQIPNRWIVGSLECSTHEVCFTASLYLVL